MKRLSRTIQFSIVAAIVWFVAFAATPNIFFATVRATVSRVKNDLRSAASAVELRRVEGVKYPAPDKGNRLPTEISSVTDFHKFCRPVDPSDAPIKFCLRRYGPVLLLAWKGVLFACFSRYGKSRGWSHGVNLVWTMAYVGVIWIGYTSWWHMNFDSPYFERLSDDTLQGVYKGFHYYTDGKNGYLLQAAGPDCETVLQPLGNDAFVTTSRSVLLKTLAPATYDPTNGTTSPGDIFYVGFAGNF